MVLSGKKKTSSMSSLMNQNQGGGSKKAGFPYQIGRSYRTSIAFDSTDPAHGHCTTLKCMQTLLFPLAHISRPIGRDNSRRYWKIPGAGV